MGYVIRCDKVTKNFAVQGEMHGNFLGTAVNGLQPFRLWQSAGFDSPGARNA